MEKVLFVITVVLILFITACKKEIIPNPPTTDSTATSASLTDLLKDSVYLYSKEIYFWDDLIPSYETFNPRQYSGTDDIKSATAVMDAIRKLQPLDHFSFVTTKANSEKLMTAEDLDHGFFIKAASVDKAAPIDSVRWFVTYVFDKSTAGIAGVKRGWVY